MKTLLFGRHAKSSWKEDNMTDFERPLNNRGKRDAPFMGALLRERNIRPDVIISSPADRAMATAILLADELKYDPATIVALESLYNAASISMREIVELVDDGQSTLIVVAHNPAITMLANTLSETPVESFPTCGIACLQFEIDSWKAMSRGAGRLVFFEAPRKHLG